MDYRDLTEKDCMYQDRLIREYRQKLSGLPEGRLLATRKRGRVEYYHVPCGGKRRYISKNKKEFILGLKLRRYYETAIKCMESNISAQKKMMNKYEAYDFLSIQRRLPSSYRTDAAAPEDADCEAPVNGLKYDGVHMTSAGFAVRSKTELMIAEMLNFAGISFTYEKPLRLKTPEGMYVTVHPDFTFRDRYGGYVYWEHFGMLGDRRYREKTMNKLTTYIENGIVPSINLVMTAETLDGALDAGTITRTIEMIKGML